MESHCIVLHRTASLRSIAPTLSHARTVLPHTHSSRQRQLPRLDSSIAAAAFVAPLPRRHRPRRPSLPLCPRVFACSHAPPHPCLTQFAGNWQRHFVTAAELATSRSPIALLRPRPATRKLFVAHRPLRPHAHADPAVGLGWRPPTPSPASVPPSHTSHRQRSLQVPASSHRTNQQQPRHRALRCSLNPNTSNPQHCISTSNINASTAPAPSRSISNAVAAVAQHHQQRQQHLHHQQRQQHLHHQQQQRH
jgi:hypothetical protein